MRKSRKRDSSQEKKGKFIAIIAYNFDRLETIIRIEKTYPKINAALSYEHNFNIKKLIQDVRKK